jgi:hypothetical protein
VDKWRVEAEGEGEAERYVIVRRNKAGGDTIGGDAIYVDRREAQAEADRLNKLLDEDSGS